MENSARTGRGKNVVNVDSSDEEVEVPAQRKGKGKQKKGKRKCKSRDMSIESFFSPSSSQFQQYIRVLDSIETHLGCKKSSSMSGLVSSLFKTAQPPFDPDAELKIALVELLALNLHIDLHLKVSDVLKDPSE